MQQIIFYPDKRSISNDFIKVQKGDYYIHVRDGHLCFGEICSVSHDKGAFSYLLPENSIDIYYHNIKESMEGVIVHHDNEGLALLVLGDSSSFSFPGGRNSKPIGVVNPPVLHFDSSKRVLP